MTRPAHICHAIGCVRACPPEHLMCKECWWEVSYETKIDVCIAQKRKKKSKVVGPEWASWIRAAHAAIAEVAIKSGHFTRERAARYVAAKNAFAASLEERA